MFCLSCWQLSCSESYNSQPRGWDQEGSVSVVGKKVTWTWLDRWKERQRTGLTLRIPHPNGQMSSSWVQNKPQQYEVFPKFLAIFSFSCQLGLRANHKTRGDPVLESVAAFFGRLITCSNTETQAEFINFLPARLGNWQPGAQPTEELQTLISSRLKATKANGVMGCAFHAVR